MTARPLKLVVLGLSLSSSWGNGHATTFRSLLSGLHALGHEVLFLERERPWYADNRDLSDPDYCTLIFYDEVAELRSRFAQAIRTADAVIVGSYVPDGVAVLDTVLDLAGGAVAFYDIDTPVTLAKLARDDREYLEARQIPQLDLYFSFTGGPTLQRLAGEFGAQRALPLYCSVEEGRYRATADEIRWDLGYLGTYSADRQAALERLLLEPARRLPQQRFVVAGPQYPADIAWPANVERIDHLPPAEHAAFYSRQRFTLNVTRADMVASGWSPSVRLFEAAACGTPIISDDWEGLSAFFPPGEAILVAHTSEQVIATLTGLEDERRRALGARARRLVLQGHTGRARARELVAALTAGASPLLDNEEGESVLLKAQYGQ